MKYSKKKYLDYMIRTIEALRDAPNNNHVFINNPGFGNIFDILKNDSYRSRFNEALISYVDQEYSETIINSLKKSSLNSFFTPAPLIRAITEYLSSIPNFKPINILEPSAGNGLIIRGLLKEFPDAKVTAFEKEILTTRILEHNFKNKPNVTAFGIPFEAIGKTTAPKNYDLVISNIPFGANKIFDPDLLKHPLKSELTSNIHSYFIYKSLKLLKQNGIALLVCTKNFMDKSKYQSIRKHLIEENNFIGAVRLPDNTFETENTSIVTDILIFQNNRGLEISKEQHSINSLFTSSIKRLIGENEVDFSAYFHEYENNIFGKTLPGGLYNNSDYTVTNEFNLVRIEPNIKSSLTKFNPLLGKAVQNSIQKKPTNNIQFNKTDQVYNGDLKPGNLFIKDQKVAKITDTGSFYFLKTKRNEFQKLSQIISLRDAYLKLIDADDYNGEKILNDLKYQYDVFVFQYGNLNADSNYQLVTIDAQGPLVLSLETPKDGQFVKSQILLEPWHGKTKKPELLSLADGIMYSMNKTNDINIDVISDSTGLQPEDIIKESLARNLLFVNPSKDGPHLTPKFRFLSGDISKKIQWYESRQFGAFQPYMDRAQISQSIVELEKVKPPITPFEDLDINLHEPWFPIEVTQSFIFDTYKTITKIDYIESTSKYAVKIESYEYSLIKKFYVSSENRNYGFKDVLEGALNSSIPYITKGSKEYKRIDRTKMQEFKMKHELIYKEFSEYVHQNSELKSSLENHFYATYEAKIMPRYNGDYLKFDGLQKFTPYRSQKDTVSGIIMNQGLLVNKEVGFGKTLDMALSAQKLRELNLSNRTLIIGLKPTLIQLQKEFLNAFPRMKLLVATDKEVSGKLKRNQFFSKIISQQPDVVLMSHDTFQFIPQSPEVIQKVVQDELDNLTKDLEVIYDNKYDINKRVLKGLETRKENLQAQLDGIYHKIESDKNDILDFDQLGFDHIMIDESHKFKNLMYTTRHSRVAGLNTSKGSQKSKNLLIAIRTLQMRKGTDFQATFLSGTPISNSITEVYVLFKYLIPNRLEELNISSFDQWAQVFANKSFEFEPTISGDYKVKERFRSFKKLKLLSSLYNEISIIVNGQTHTIERPKIAVDVNTLKPTQVQKDYFEQIKLFLKTGNSEYLYGAKKYSDEQKTALSLIALHHMRNASIDTRLLNPFGEDNEETKLWTVAKEVHKTYTESNHFKGTQAIFSDLGTPKESFNVYHELKRILTEELGVPDEEIVFIHDFKSDSKRLECFKKVNAGDFRIIIGSTEKLGTGTNIQERLIRIHHVNIPHRPTDVDQRNGRGVRKGNVFAKTHWNNQVIVSFYIVENSTDSLMLNNINTKKNFIEQITNGTIQFNRLELGDVDENGGIDYKTLLAVAKNDPLYLEKEHLTKELEELVLEQSIFKKNKLEAQNNVKFYSKELETAKNNLSILNDDVKHWHKLQDREIYYSKVKSVLGMSQSSTPKDLGDAILRKVKTLKSQNTEIEIFKIESSSLKLKIKSEGHTSLLVKTENASYGYGLRKLVSNPISMANYFYNALSKIPKSIENQETTISEYQELLEANNKILNLSFDKVDQLIRIEGKLSQISIDLDNKFSETQSEEEEKEKDKTIKTQKGISNNQITR
ncbi:hypothetical protein EYD46_12580 [Hyunsoonleella pacifica]|uniref:Helicase C-terminal domain-containing protein n=2 Tax=Hyunsoonleella pacifica TaxID=1080224 RepID=A0A4Q9FL78_9FLAO|nr:hypothetical protein EYD46_12580 [Hyunsoonleella pacifica]GGD13450.1 hypothetical protein GCM10011368_14300 [Hyunsoonleella pacifica]